MIALLEPTWRSGPPDGFFLRTLMRLLWHVGGCIVAGYEAGRLPWVMDVPVGVALCMGWAMIAQPSFERLYRICYGYPPPERIPGSKLSDFNPVNIYRAIFR